MKRLISARGNGACCSACAASERTRAFVVSILDLEQRIDFRAWAAPLKNVLGKTFVPASSHTDVQASAAPRLPTKEFDGMPFSKKCG